MGVVIAGVGWLVALSAYDIRRRRLPNWLTLPGAVAILCAATWSGRGSAALAGAAALAALYGIVHVISPRAMGGGDVKLALGVGAMTGAFGLDVWVLAALGAPILTSVVALVALLRGNATVPHGPSMCLASAAAIGLVLV
ncbi:prepilin peptidase [Mycolicibacterium wolinskyi]|uniref:prepilin peptidase n=1 Tax=Mycolicibacterium wolinskyi TaxID=59750 RepID=UPI00391784FE